MMGLSVIRFLLSSILLLSCFLLQSQPVHSDKKSYIVYLGSHSHGPTPSAHDQDSATSSHYSLLASHLGSEKKAKEAIFYSYNKHINGFAALLEKEEAADIARNPKVVSVFKNRGHKLQTTRSWEFLGLESSNGQVSEDSMWKKARYGEDTIIGNIDTGVWPESESFKDEGMGPVPSRWRGVCQLDNFRCNRKLIGARFFSNGYESQFGKLNESLYTARDEIAHGTPTLSVAGGNFVRGVSVLGFGNGTAKGGSPRARVAAYKVCWLSVTGIQCTDADVMDAFDAAISDGVDVISFSLGKPVPPEFFRDGFSIGAFHAIANGVMVVAGAGNEGPGFGTVTNVAPWMFTVAASSIDRDFANYIVLGDQKHILGSSLSTGLPSENFYPLINSVDAKAANATVEDAQLCNAGSLDPEKAKGKILVCLVTSRDGILLAEQGAVLAGAVGLILANDEKRGNDIMAVVHLLPASHINFTDGEYIYSYTKLTKAPRAYMTRAKTRVGIKPAPVVASLSSRGPSIIQPAILKPDVTAPGLDILYANPDGLPVTAVDSDKRRFPFNIGSGTSIACPHVSGIVGLLKTAYPHWSPAAIRSAIMTTAMTLDNNNRPISDQSKQEPSPFAYGAGHIQPDLAMDPGLVYDLNTDDYLNFLCAHDYNQTQIMLFSKSPYSCPEFFTIADFNYPSISVPNLAGYQSVTVTRTLTNVGDLGTYSVHVKAPHAVHVLVEPSLLKFEKAGEKKTFKVILKWIGEDDISDYVFGEIMWSDGKHKVKSPIVVKHI
ncbi:hypothetical protein QN277_018370 [Acacia crassicarpa]|uniref:Uncharacterized protein n=2 Tax=Acacia crassicarpa TaxID=499986 RepID=A0AAE1KJB5_9FABA|nr:hypothetical protein QN277_018370 [Acacia crassicarpa]